jgi:hypothetical protein
VNLHAYSRRIIPFIVRRDEDERLRCFHGKWTLS